MARGFTRGQIGVTEQMIQTFGDTIFNLSHNYQVRRGDPVRELNWEEIERQRESMGLTDVQIGEKIGLDRHQVLYIRTVIERRRFHTGHYHRLLDLGGGRRFRAERFTPHQDHFRFGEDALELRAAMNFPPDLARKYVEEGWWRDETLKKWLARAATDSPDAPAIRHAGETMTYGELASRVDRLARALYDIGIRHGDVVSVQLPNVPEFIVSYLALTQLGGVMQTIHMPYREREIETLVNHGRSRALICLAETKDWTPAQTVLDLKGQLPTLKHVIALGNAPDGALSLGDLIASDVDVEIAEEPLASDPFLLLYTSGTTSAPKGVPLGYHNMLSNARAGVPEHKIGPEDVVISAAPFSHLFGLYSLHIALASGAAILLLPVFTPGDLAQIVEEEEPTALWSAPAHMAACRNLGLFDQHDFGSLKLMILSGSACPPDLVRWLQQTLPGCAVTQLWGMTETQAGLYTRPDDSPEKSVNSAGRPSPGTEVRIVDDNGNELANGEEGELQVRGPLLFPGYLRNEAANAEAFAEGGWFRSGDLATRDADDFVTITGRKKDVINRGGVKFNPRDIEDILDSNPRVMASAIVPMPDDVLGERACVFITLARPGDEPTLEELCAYLLEQNIAKNKLPEKLVIVDEFPMTPTRKIIKGQLKLPDA